MSGFDEWPPPTVPEPSPAQAPSVLVEVEPAPKPRRRAGLLVGVLALVVLAGAAIGFVAFSGSDDAAESYSLTAAAESAGSATGVEYEMNMSMGEMGSITATVRADTQQDLMAMQMSMMEVEMSMIFDVANGMAYLDTEAMSMLSDQAPTRWISYDVSSEAGFSDALSQGLPDNPLDIAPLFAQATSVEDLGMAEVEGEQVKHYRVTLDTAGALEQMPQLEDQFEQLDQAVPETLVYDVYVTEDNQLRRMTSSIEVGGVTAKTDIVVTKVGDIAPIELPDPADVTDMTGALGG